VLLGTAAPCTTNAGRTYVFSGVLDERDVDHAHGADVVGGAMRELVEETGLEAHEIEPASPWIWSIEDGVWINFVVECRTQLPAEELRRRILAHNAVVAGPELADVTVIRSAADLDRRDIFDNTRMLVRHLLSAEA
jgi:8-oxo-dGTP pyrophosphatase MutT (NUDIX family)